ncbi:flippase-like domain-containing protein [Fulvivirga sp. 29W222]|uniref:Flippase-like domain-containing protein n=1 Tax=Fulvivirga marina TaxID=2494733 RepID=A0A937G1H0_9BACT|nr:lysylphosphatidylglycerol synthase domain-containing protein [Fulvivirga marina]MBL6448328.1 flippase-like domain-containing protein [Fulvivirga marina]
MPDLIKTSFYKRALWPILKAVILILLISFIYLKLQGSRDSAETTRRYIQTILHNNVEWLVVVMGLMFVNWGIEAVKWMVLVKPLAKMSFLSAIKGVLTGLSLSFMTPHGLGDYFGRVMQAGNPNRGRYIGAIMLGRFCQMVPTALFGTLGLYYISATAMWVYVFLALVAGGTILLIYHNGYRLIEGVMPEKFKNKLIYYFGIINMYSFVEVVKVLLLSIFRYFVFALQFGVILALFLPGIGLDLNIAGVTWIFLSKSILPTFNFLSDLGVREFSAIYFYEKYQVDLMAVVSASLTLWLINILVPTIIGAPLTLKMRLKAK